MSGIETIVGTAWHSPGSIYNIGSHKAVSELLKVGVQVQEKIDGSFFAFGLHPEIDKGEGPLRIRSKGSPIEPEAPPAMFSAAVSTVKVLPLREGWQYRGEVLSKPKHSALAYERIPTGHIILFDIAVGEEDFLPYDQLAAEAARLGLEVVPQFGEFKPGECTLDILQGFHERMSILGGTKVEGVVIKPLEPLYGVDKKRLLGKLVSAAFKEAHSKAWGEANPSGSDIITRLGERYCHPGRWLKALQHLREAGLITDSLRDIGPLIKEVPLDVKKEEIDNIKDDLFKWAWPHIARFTTKGLPDWYKELILNQQAEAAIAAKVDEAVAEVMMEEAKGG